MGIMNALSTAVSGLSAQSYALENISGNIANSQTTGFKRVDTSFVDLIPETPIRHAAAGSVAAYSTLTNSLQGGLRTTGVATNLALSGDGFFTVSQNVGSASAPTFPGGNQFTRRGDFAPDAAGYLVNGAGNYLVGSASGGAGGAPIRISRSPMAARPSSAVTYSANLPSYPKTGRSDPTVAGSELLDPALAAGATIAGTDEAAFLNQTVPGGETTLYDAAGTAVTLELRWAKTATSTGGGADTWALYYQNNPAATGAAAAWTRAGGPVTFTPGGALTSGSSFTIPGLTVNGTTFGAVDVQFGANALTQYSDANGIVNGADVGQNGYGSGSLSDIEVASDGRIIGSYSNGQIATLSQISIAHFTGEDALRRLDGGVFAQTADSGPPTYGLGDTSLTSGSVEQSNTDISEEFSKMIVTQQAYSANTRVMSTAQQMLQDIINVIR